MSVQQVPAGYKYIWQVIGGQQTQVLVPDQDSAPSIYDENPQPQPWKHPVASIYELQSILRQDCEDGDVRMVLGVGVYVFWADSQNPTGLPPLDGQFVAGRWQFITDGGNLPSWVQTKELPWASTVLINGDGFTTIRIPILGDTILNGGSGVDGQKLVLELTQDPTGYHGITLGAKFQFGSDIPSLTFSILPGTTDYVGLIYNAPKDKWRVIAYSRGY
jgi:hypothetical protein